MATFPTLTINMDYDLTEAAMNYEPTKTILPIKCSIIN